MPPSPLSDARRVLRWATDIYHPALARDVVICDCLSPVDAGEDGVSTDGGDLHSAAKVSGPDAEARQWAALGLVTAYGRLRATLRQPHLFRPCHRGTCPLQTGPLAEAHADPTFFRYKARLHTPNTAPLADDEIRALAAQKTQQPTLRSAMVDLDVLLRTGAFSDLRIVSVLK
jgi:hypothetical protein